MRPKSERFNRLLQDANRRSLGSVIWLLHLALSLFCCSVLVFSGCSGSRAKESSSGPSSNGETTSIPVTCGSSHYPVKSDANWEYRFRYAGGQPRPTAWSQHRINIAHGSFIDHLDFTDGGKADIRWKCTGEGMLNTEFWHIATQRMSAQTRLDTIKNEGITLPSQTDWRVGSKWQSTYYVVEAGKSRSEEVSSARPESKIETSNEIISQELVSVQAGTFSCFVVKSTTSGPLRSLSRSLIQTKAWYADGIGLVKLVFAGDLGTGDVELVSLK